MIHSPPTLFNTIMTLPAFLFVAYNLSFWYCHLTIYSAVQATSGPRALGLRPAGPVCILQRDLSPQARKELFWCASPTQTHAERPMALSSLHDFTPLLSLNSIVINKACQDRWCILFIPLAMHP